MLGNAIKTTTTTTGAGDLTLASAAGYPTFFQLFGLNRIFAYVILDANGLFLEAGIGHMSDATTLVRAKVTATYSAGSYNNASPTALNLAAGTYSVIGTLHEATAESILPTVDSQSTGVNRYIAPSNRTYYTAAVSTGVLRCYYYPVLIKVGSPIASLAINVTTAGGAGTMARAGIYSVKANGYIGDLLASTGDLPIDTTGIKNGTLSSPIFLPPGWYYAAVVCGSATGLTGWGSNTQYSVGGSPLGFASGSVTPIEMRYEALASVVLPASANGTTTPVNMASTNVPAVYFGV